MKNKVLLFMAVSLGLISAFLVYNYLSNLEAGQYVELVDVVVANTKIPANTRVKASMLAWKKVPADMRHSDAVYNLQDVQGRITNSEIIPGEQVLWSRLLPEGQVPGMAFTIPNDKRAITIAVNEVIGVAGFIKPGDAVDVLATFEAEVPITTTVLENVIVLAIAQEMESKQNPKAELTTSVTFALSPQQVERLVLAESQGALRLALRPPQAVGIASRQGTNILEIQPLAYSNYREDLNQRQEVANQPLTADTDPVGQLKLTDPNLNRSKTEIEIIRGTKQEVRVIYE
ncbi:MAG: Flp pilus assembly protein CpaB [Firmicutes bacterium]|nr:Flp pilus assembly protein CpaB [Bacillota bacterium]